MSKKIESKCIKNKKKGLFLLLTVWCTDSVISSVISFEMLILFPFYLHFVTETRFTRKKTVKKMLIMQKLRDLQLWMSGSFCQSGTSSLTSVTSCFSRLLKMVTGHEKERKEQLISEHTKKTVSSQMSLSQRLESEIWRLFVHLQAKKFQVYLLDCGTWWRAYLIPGCRH